MKDIIKVEDVSFAYDEEQETINHISFTIQKGQYVTILGHNGSGKSTIAKLLIGLLDKKEGKIVVADKELNIDSLYAIREHIGIVFQNPDNQFIGATVRDDIAFGLENMCIKPTEMDALIEKFAKRVGMIDFLDHEP
ncbi:MAG: ATP-binding cassette domain-containing protein, partial [Coprobacillaceae bacterium]